MGGKVQQTNPAQAAAANAGATKTADALNTQAASNLKTQQSYMGRLFGDGSAGSTGTLSAMQDPAALNVKGPSGPYQTMYQNQTGTISKNAEAAQGALRQNMANRGFSSGSGMEAADNTQLALGEGQAKGQAYSDAFNNTYQTALNNFWNSNNLMSGNAATIGAQGTQQMGSAAQTYNNLYGTAGQGQVVPGTGAAIMGGVGTALGGLLSNPTLKLTPCFTADTLIFMFDGSQKKVQDLREGDLVKAHTWRIPNRVQRDVEPILAECVTIVAENGRSATAAERHQFIFGEGGYLRAHEVKSRMLESVDGGVMIDKVDPAGELSVYPVELDGDHTYCGNGFWSLA